MSAKFIKILAWQIRFKVICVRNASSKVFGLLGERSSTRKRRTQNCPDEFASYNSSAKGTSSLRDLRGLPSDDGHLHQCAIIIAYLFFLTGAASMKLMFAPPATLLIESLATRREVATATHKTELGLGRECVSRNVAVAPEICLAAKFKT
jgi:hypothetical protein